MMLHVSPRVFLAAVILWLGWNIIVPIAGAATKQECSAEQDGTCANNNNKEPDCGVYMAPSTLGDDTSMGIYTAKPLKKDEVVNFPEIAIPLLFREWHDHGDNPDGILWDRYIWEGSIADIESKNEYDVEDQGAVFVPGVGCTINSILEMNNIYSTHGSRYDTAGLHRSKDPGVGAYTPYHASQTTAKRDIPAGGELFAAYGDEWIPEIPEAIITFNANLDKADDFLQDYQEWMQSHENIMSLELQEALWEWTTRDFPTLHHSRVLGALPKQASWAQVSAMMSELSQHNKEQQQEDNDDDEEQGSVVRHFIRQSGTRSLDWLKQHGKCQDHIKPGRSTIPQAGMGAFANRFLPKGTVVGYSPLVHMGNNRELWNIPYHHDEQQHDRIKYEKQDLILNYSFGHGDSTLLLTPYGAMVNYINHDKEKANVRVVWPQQELIAHKPEWLTKDLDFLINTHDKIGLSFDYIALRDIDEGEEIFMDYGDEWEQAWNDHVAKWTPPPDANNYVHSSEWNETTLRTMEELEENPYPSNLHTMCRESYKRGPDGDLTWTDLVRENDTSRVKCWVLERSEGNGDDLRYTVLLEQDDEEGVTRNVEVTGVPSPEGIQLVDVVRSSDWHLENAFRHEIMVPDDIFPDSWKNGRGKW